jgi:hypothetical protein
MQRQTITVPPEAFQAVPSYGFNQFTFCKAQCPAGATHVEWTRDAEDNVVITYKPASPVIPGASYKAEARKELAAWFQRDIADPFTKRCRADGIPDHEISNILREAVFEALAKLHGFRHMEASP